MNVYPPGYVWSLPAEDVIMLLIEAKKREIEEKLFFRWVTSYQTEMPFDEFKKKITPDRRSAKEIVEETNQYLKLFSSGMEKVDINGNI